MKKQIKLSALAVVIGSVMVLPSAAFAHSGKKGPKDDPDPTVNHATSVLSNHQVQVFQATFSASADNTAGVGDYSGQNAKGRIGENVAAGSQNMQGNNLVISNAGGTNTSSYAGIWSDQDGAIFSLAILGQVTNTSYLNGDALWSASGNIGVNIASGAQNMQANNVAGATGNGTDNSAPHQSAVAQIFDTQSGGPFSGSLAFGTSNSASVGGNALRAAKGNIGANVASGAQNVQANNLAISRNHTGTNSFSLTKVSQITMGRLTANLPTQCPSVTPVNTATVGGHSLMNASGNIGLNVAAGYGNLQNNTLTISNSMP